MRKFTILRLIIFSILLLNMTLSQSHAKSFLELQEKLASCEALNNKQYNNSYRKKAVHRVRLLKINSYGAGTYDASLSKEWNNSIRYLFRNFFCEYKVFNNIKIFHKELKTLFESFKTGKAILKRENNKYSVILDDKKLQETINTRVLQSPYGYLSIFYTSYNGEPYPLKSDSFFLKKYNEDIELILAVAIEYFHADKKAYLTEDCSKPPLTDAFGNFYICKEYFRYSQSIMATKAIMYHEVMHIPDKVFFFDKLQTESFYDNSYKGDKTAYNLSEFQRDWVIFQYLNSREINGFITFMENIKENNRYKNPMNYLGKKTYLKTLIQSAFLENKIFNNYSDFQKSIPQSFVQFGN